MLSPEQQNVRMSVERAVLTKLLESAVAGDFGTLQSVVLDYVAQHHNAQEAAQPPKTKGKGSTTTAKASSLSIADVLTQFKDAQKRTALHFACQSKATAASADIVELILDWLQSVSSSSTTTTDTISKVLRCKDAEGLTPLMMAAQCFDAATTERRVVAILAADSKAASAGGSSSSTSISKLGLGRSKAGATALHYAAANGATPRTIDALILAGKVALTTFSTKGGTPLHWACSVPPSTTNHNHIATIEALLRHGADINAHNESIPPPLALTLAAGHAAHAKCLLQWRSSASSSDNSSTSSTSDIIRPSVTFILQPGNVTMLHMAADMNLPGVLSLLLEHVAAAVNGEQDDKLEHEGNTGTSTLLEQTNSEGYTALDLAAKQGHSGCVMLLLNAVNQASTEEDALLYIATWNANNNTTNSAASTTPSTSKDERVDTAAPNSSSEDDPLEAKAKLEAASLQQTHADTTFTDEQLLLAEEHKARGNTHYAQQEWQLAIDAYSAAIEIHPLNATYYSNRSASYMALHNVDCALHDAVVARCLQPLWPKAAYRMAVARLALERYEDAAVAAWEGLQQDADNDELKRLLQKCVKKGRKDFQESKKKET